MRGCISLIWNEYFRSLYAVKCGASVVFLALLYANVANAGVLAIPVKVDAMSILHCEIRTRPVGQGMEITGVVWANGIVMGDFSLNVRSEGAGGMSNVGQSGLFSTQPNQSSVLGSVVVNSGEGSSFSARLTITSDDTVDCTAEL